MARRRNSLTALLAAAILCAHLTVLAARRDDPVTGADDAEVRLQVQLLSAAPAQGGADSHSAAPVF